MKLTALLLLPLGAELALGMSSGDVYRAHHRDVVARHGGRPLNRMPLEPRISPLVLKKRSARCSARNGTSTTTTSHAVSTSSAHPSHQSSVLHFFTSTSEAPVTTSTKAAAPPPPPPPPHTTSTPAPPPPPATTHSTTEAAKTTAPASPPSSGGGDTSSSDINAYLTAHNTVRAQHGASPLTWSDSLATAAASWADKCEFQHSGGTLGPYGENLAAGSGDYSIASAVQSWANEEPQYSSSNPQASHYTQMVWKSSTQLGCAVISCNLPVFTPNFWPAKFYVCEYFPQGNVIGAFAQNVQ